MEEARMKDGGGRIPIQMLAIANLCNQLLRAGISIGANNAEATNAISKADFKSKSFIALKEARESLYWLQLLHRNKYIDDCQHESLYADCEELVKILVHRCKKLNDNDKTNLDEPHLPSNILHHQLPLDQRATPGSTKQNFLELPFRFLLAEAGRNMLVPITA